jgi:hypothetical protein
VKGVVFMRRITLVLGVAVVMAAMIALTVSSALAKDSNRAKTKYTDPISGYEYYAVSPRLSATGEGIGQFRATVDPEEGDLPGELDATIYYTGLPAGPNVTSEITHGTWILCSHGFTAPPLDIRVNPPTPIPPECNAGTPDPGSTIALQGVVRGGTIRWREEGYYVLSPLGTPLWIGKADVKSPLGITGGTVYGVPVEKGSGKFKGTLDHSPLTLPPDPITGLRQPPTVVGTLRLKFLDVRDGNDLDTAEDGKGRCPKCHSHQRQRDDLDTANDGNGVDN